MIINIPKIMNDESTGIDISPLIYGFYDTTVSESTVPYDFGNGDALIFENELHVLGGTNGKTKHYKYNFETKKWTVLNSLPYYFYGGSAVVYQGTIHIMGGVDSTDQQKHYKWNKTSDTWSSASTIFNYFYNGVAVVDSDGIHAIGSGNSSYYRLHRIWDGSSWTNSTSIPSTAYHANAVVKDSKIHVFGGHENTKYYTWDGSSWTEQTALSYNADYGATTVVNNQIHLFGGGYIATRKNHWVLKDTTWTKVNDIPYELYGGNAVTYRGEAYLISDTNLTRVEYGTYVRGYLRKGTTIYLPVNSSPVTTNLEAVTDGYKVTADGEVRILLN